MLLQVYLLHQTRHLEPSWLRRANGVGDNIDVARETNEGEMRVALGLDGGGGGGGGATGGDVLALMGDTRWQAEHNIEQLNEMVRATPPTHPQCP